MKFIVTNGADRYRFPDSQPERAFSLWLSLVREGKPATLTCEKA